MAEKKNTSAAKWMAILIIVALVVVVAVAAAASLSRKKQAASEALSKVRLNPEILTFTLQTIPDIYRGLFRFNNQLLLIDKELERLNDIETEFPNQKIYITAHAMVWMVTILLRESHAIFA